MGTAVFILGVLGLPVASHAWGSAGHALVARAALRGCAELPPWFRAADGALATQANAPDRWKDVDARVPALRARRADHFFDLDDWGAEALPPDRWAYVRRAGRRRLDAAGIGFLPYAILEQYGILLAAFRDARAGRAGGREAALAAAGLLAHFAGDASVPLHATRHHHGWVGPNPRGFTRQGGVHEWFESELVAGEEGAPLELGAEAGRPLRSPPEAVRAALADSLAQVPLLYEAQRESRAGDPRTARTLVRARLDAGATLVARLWCTAWVRSGG